MVSTIIREQLDLAKEIIKEHSEIFDVLVDELMNKTHLNKRELENLLLRSK